ncbi:MAG: glycosyltransferase [Planctomycetaceae bacterium]
MPAWQILLLAAYGVLVLSALSRHLVCSYQIRRTRFLTPHCPRIDSGNAPLVSIMVPAKDEAAHIEGCVRSLLAQEYPNFEVLVVDDRSEDNTAAIVASIAAQDERVRLIRVDTLPAGWTGKTHALHVCQQHARGDWFLFVDADTRHHPSCLSVTLRDCLDNGMEMESLFPALDSRTFWERVIQPFVGTCLIILFPLTRVNDPRRKSAGFANGQFILVSRKAYQAIGGHEAVRDKLVEDIHMGRKIREQGFGLRMAVGADVSSVRMYSSLDQIIRGWVRIFYAAVDFNPSRLRWLFAFICVFSVLPYAVISGYGIAMLCGVKSPFVVISFVMGVIHEAGQVALYARTYASTRSQLRYLAFRWLAVFAMLLILRRTIAMCRTHDVVWRGTAYSKELQKAA